MKITQRKSPLVSATPEFIADQTQPFGSASPQGLKYAPRTAFAKRFFPLNSIGFKLFLYVMSGALVGLGGMSYFFYQTLEQEAKGKIQDTLDYQVALMQGQLTEVEQATADMASSINILHRMGAKDPAYKDLTFDYYRKRVSLTMGVGFGQLPNQIVPSLKYYYPYFYTVKGFPDAAGTGQALPAPYTADIRYSELFKDDSYQDKEYFKIPIADRHKVWVEPFDWHGISMTSFVYPLFNDRGQLLGVTDNDVNVTALSEQIKGSVFQGAGYFAILSAKGNLLVDPVNPEQAKARESYQQLPALKAIWPQLQQGQSGLVQARGNIWAYRRIPNTNWLMLAVVPQSVVLGPVLAVTVVAMLGAGVVLALVVALFVRKLNRGLQPILHECNKLAAENVANKAQMPGQDEIGQLSTSFFNLLEQLAINEKQLLREVDERLKQAFEVQQESEVLQADVSHILDVVSTLEQGDLTVQAQVSDRATGLVADTINRLIEELVRIMTVVLSTAQQVTQGAENLEQQAILTTQQAQQQTHSVNNMQALMENVNNLCQNTVQQATVSNEAVQQAQIAVTQGQQEMVTMTKGIVALQQGTEQIVKRAQMLTNFVALADKFAKDQKRVAALTRVLALNASMSAARASGQQDPEQFASVAREFETIATQVNDLAVQTNQSLILLQQRTDKIQTVVSGINEDVQDISGSVNQFTLSVDQSRSVFDNIKMVTERVVKVGEEVTQSSHEIATVAQTTLQSIQDIAAAASQTERQSRYTHEQAGWMDQIARTLLEKVQFFRLSSESSEQLSVNDEQVMTDTNK